MLRVIRVVFVGTSLLVLISCAQKCASEEIAMGVARLTTLNADAALALLLDDANCGFNSSDVLDSAIIDGAPGEIGRITWTVEDCEIDLEEEVEVTHDPLTENPITARGTIFVNSAEKTIEGYITGLSEDPIIPTGPNSLALSIYRLEFENFSALRQNKDEYLVWNSGSISGNVFPRLARDNDLGFCSVVTDNVGFSDVVYEGSLVTLRAKDRHFVLGIRSSDIFGQFGQGEIEEDDDFIENHLEGYLDISGETFAIPIPDDRRGLDPAYSPEEFSEAQERLSNVSIPISYDCISPVSDI